jgi:hypothetical protein
MLMVAFLLSGRCGQGDTEGRADTRFALDVDLPPAHQYGVPGDGQPQAITFPGLFGASLHPVESLEKVFEML